MPLGVRDLLLVVRAKDQASRTLREIGNSFGTIDEGASNTRKKMQTLGSGLLAAGAAIGGIGAAGVALFGAATKAAIDFDSASRKTLTQVSGFQASLKEVEQVALDVGRTIPIPFEQLQPALFDIFSSIPVKNMSDARDILKQMSQAAVAGSTDVQTVARSNFEIMNALGLKVGDLNHLLDVQFKLVQLGIGDYASINQGIGRLAPTAAIAGQSIDTMGGALAFATRIMGPGGSAISSVARAFEALANPAVAKKLAKLGISVKDLKTGEFRQFNDVLADMSKKLKGLPGPQRVAAITEIFKGAGGTIQARRFLNEAIMQSDALQTSVHAMTGSAGEMQKAFKIMADSPAARLQALNNQFQMLKILIGQALLPVVGQLIKFVQPLVDWFYKLDESTRTNIIRWGAFISLALVVMGAIAGLVGAILLIVGTLGIFTAIIPAVIALGILLYKNWDTVKQAFLELVKVIMESPLGPILTKLIGYFKGVADRGKENLGILSTAFDEVLHGQIFAAVSDVADYLDRTFGTNGQIARAFWGLYYAGQSVWEAVSENFHKAVTELSKLVSDVFGDIANWWNKYGSGMIESVTTTFSDFVNRAQSLLQPFLDFMKNLFNTILIIVRAAFIGLKVAWDLFGADFLQAVSTVWNTLWAIIKDALRIVIDIVKAFFDIFNGDWGKAWHAIVDMAGGIFRGLWDVIKGAFDLIMEGQRALVAPFNAIFTAMWSGVQGVFVSGINFVIDAYNTARDLYMKIPSWARPFDLPKLNHVYVGGTTTIGDLGGPIQGTGGNFKQFQQGGIFSSPQAALALLHPGEGVLPSKAMQSLTAGEFEALRTGRGMDSGGGLTLAPGAVQVIIQGNPDERVAQMVGDHVEYRLREMYNEARQR